MLRRSFTADGLSAIYGDHVNLATWCRSLCTTLQGYAEALSCHYPGFMRRLVLPASITAEALRDELPSIPTLHESARQAFAADLALLCDMYGCLFDVREIGLRLTVMEHAMCPRFHVDHVVCRMICTYRGQGTEWLPEAHVNRVALGNNPGEASHNMEGIEQIDTGTVALLKGEAWPGNQGRGLVHRSPAASPEQNRVVATLDPVA